MRIYLVHERRQTRWKGEEFVKPYVDRAGREVDLIAGSLFKIVIVLRFCLGWKEIELSVEKINAEGSWRL